MKALFDAACVLAFAVAAGAWAVVARAQAVTVSIAPAACTLDDEAFLWAVREKETLNRPRAINRKSGARSAYQLLEATWRLHTREPFVLATTCPEFAEVIARRHLRFLKNKLAARQLDRDAIFFAMAWGFGGDANVAHARDDYTRELHTLYLARVAEKERP